jgi:hypothetical protein
MNSTTSTISVLPLSEAQRSLWFLYQMNTDQHAAHNIGFCVRLRGALSPGAVDDALQTLVARHPMLRSSFDVLTGQLLAPVVPCKSGTVGCEPVALPSDELGEAFRITIEGRRYSLDRLA